MLQPELDASGIFNDRLNEFGGGGGLEDAAHSEASKLQFREQSSLR